jgi:hypothetical protein
MAKKKSTPTPEIQNEIISNWVQSNGNRLAEIASENPALYDAVNQALNYLNSSLGGTKPITKIEAQEAPKKSRPNPYLWRIKTADEFEDEYGKDWRKEFVADSIFIDESTLGKYLVDILMDVSYLEKANLQQFEAVTKDGYVIDERFITYYPLPEPKEWRVKTEQEFKSEYGENWRGVVEWTVHNEKDVFFGKPLKEILIAADVADLDTLQIKSLENNLYLSIKPELDPRGKGFQYPIGAKDITQKPHPDKQFKEVWDVAEGDRMIISEPFEKNTQNGFKTYLIDSFDIKGETTFSDKGEQNPLLQEAYKWVLNQDTFTNNIIDSTVKVIKKPSKFNEGQKIIFAGTEGAGLEILKIGYDPIAQEYNYLIRSTVDGKQEIFNEKTLLVLLRVANKQKQEFKDLKDLLNGDRIILFNPIDGKKYIKENPKAGLLTYKVLKTKSGVNVDGTYEEFQIQRTGSTDVPAWETMDYLNSLIQSEDLRVLKNKPKYEEGQIVKSPSGLPDVEIKEVGYDRSTLQYVYWVDVKGSGETLWDDKSLDSYAEFTGKEESTSESTKPNVPTITPQEETSKTTYKPAPVNWTYLGAQRPNYLEILEILKKRRLSKDDKVQIAVFFGKLSMLTKGTPDFENLEKNEEQEALEQGESFTPIKGDFYQRYEVYPEYEDFLGFGALRQPTKLITFDWIQELIFPTIASLMDRSNDNLKMRNYIIETEKQNRGFSLVENEIRAAEDAAKKPSKKSVLDKYKTDDDDLESALENLEI